MKPIRWNELMENIFFLPRERQKANSCHLTVKSSLNRLLQLVAFAVLGVFILGFVIPPLGAWTGAILSVWLIGTQKVWRGFLLLAGIDFILHLLSNWHGSPLLGIEYIGRTMLAVLISVLPFLVYRLTSQRQQNFLSTLSLPLWGVVLQTLWQQLQHISVISGKGAISFFIYWFAALIIWIWNREFRSKKLAMGSRVFGAGSCILVLGFGLFLQIFHPVVLLVRLTSPPFAWVCFVGGVILSAWTLIRPGMRHEIWANKTETVALLRSPHTGDSLRFIGENGQEALVSQSGERFPVRKGIPFFLEIEKLTGSNHKYNQLYEIIGGFYDDIQRVQCALRGISLGRYLSDYLQFLEIKPGDSVLETSVGTGLNFKYLPRGVRRFGLDLSAEMLTNCQANLSRWEMDADLFLGNAEELPFANNSFDVVFHVGGINFFNDRVKAIREMIRVAKPGSRILIADETEEHVKRIYERLPLTSGFFRNRKEAVTAPIDLVPQEMQEIHLEMLRNRRFYVLTFCKPL
jgi:ubiquinone/menaquinone biosynthesis C-methylase UbiE